MTLSSYSTPNYGLYKSDESKNDLVNKLYNSKMDGDVLLEPRLLEYIRRKKFNKQHKIKPCIELEREYMITSNDKRIIKSFLKGQPINPYSTMKTTKYDYMKPQYFPSKQLLETDERTRKFQTNYKPPNHRLNPRIDPKMEHGVDSFNLPYVCETEKVKSMPSNNRPRNRSYGYRNPVENYFTYIDRDFNNPDYSVLPFPRGGDATRNENKKLSSQSYVREIL